MGKWNYKRLRSQNTVNYTVHDPKLLSPDDWKSNVLSWEKQFCLTVGSVPWNKVMVVKYYMGCHGNVVKWNASGVEEAFTNAKERFWANINGRPCDIPLPDRNMFIEEVDWNPEIDPELISDLENDCFNPKDEGEDLKKVETVEDENYNPWEGAKAHEISLRDVIEFSSWGDGFNKKTSHGNEKNACEHSDIHGNGGGAANGATWLSRDKNNSGGWKQEGKVHDERPWSNNYNSNYRSQNGGYSKAAGWGNSSNNYRAQNQINNDRDWGWRQQLPQNNDRNCFDSGLGTSQWRKREGPPQYSSRHKNPRFHGDEGAGDHHWRNGNNQNR